MSPTEKRIVFAGLVVFGLVTTLVALGRTEAFDTRVAEYFQAPDGSPAAESQLIRHVRDVTALGGWALLITFTALTTTGLALANRRPEARLLLFSMVAGILLTIAVKYTVGRERPEFTTQFSAGMPSYPSGHASMSVTLYFTLSVLLGRAANRTSVRRFCLGAAVFLAVAVGLSRIYLSVHYPSDVIGGWALGIAWATLWCARMRRASSTTEP